MSMISVCFLRAMVGESIGLACWAILMLKGFILYILKCDSVLSLLVFRRPKVSAFFAAPVKPEPRGDKDRLVLPMPDYAVCWPAEGRDLISWDPVLLVLNTSLLREIMSSSSQSSTRGLISAFLSPKYFPMLSSSRTMTKELTVF